MRNANLKYKYFFSKERSRIFSIVVLNNFHLDSFKGDMYCPCCKEATLFFKKEAKTPHLAKFPSSNHSTDCTNQLVFFNESDLKKLEKKEIQNKLRNKFDVITQNNINDMAIEQNEGKLEAIIILNGYFSRNVEYNTPYFIVGRDIKIKKHLKNLNNNSEDCKNYKIEDYKNFITLYFRDKLLLGMGFSNTVKEKIFKVVSLEEDNKEYNISVFSEIILKDEYRNISIENPYFIEIW